MRYVDLTRGILRFSPVEEPAPLPAGEGEGETKPKKKYFKNTITIDIATSVKNISVKLSPVTIQMCGASSRADGIEAAQHVIDHLLRAQRFLEMRKTHRPLVLNTLAAAQKATRGIHCYREFLPEAAPGGEKPKAAEEEKNGARVVIKRESEAGLKESGQEREEGQDLEKRKVEDFFVNKCARPAEGEVDPELFEYFCNLSLDFKYHSDFCAKMDWWLNVAEKVVDSQTPPRRSAPAPKNKISSNRGVKTSPAFAPPAGAPAGEESASLSSCGFSSQSSPSSSQSRREIPILDAVCVGAGLWPLPPLGEEREEPVLRIVHVKEAMVNCNFEIGFKINRYALRDCISESQLFVARFDNLVEYNVAVELPYTPDYDPFFPPKKDKKSRHSFLVYRSGRCTISSPSFEKMRPAYYLFRRMMEQIRPRIEQKEE